MGVWHEIAWHAGEESRVTKKLDLQITDYFLTHLENSGVQHNHDKAGDIEGSQRGIDNKVRVVKRANERFW